MSTVTVRELDPVMLEYVEDVLSIAYHVFRYTGPGSENFQVVFEKAVEAYFRAKFPRQFGDV